MIHDDMQSEISKSYAEKGLATTAHCMCQYFDQWATVYFLKQRLCLQDFSGDYILKFAQFKSKLSPYMSLSCTA